MKDALEICEEEWCCNSAEYYFKIEWTMGNTYHPRCLSHRSELFNKGIPILHEEYVIGKVMES